MQVVFNCQALVFKFDLSQNLYVPIVNDVCDIQLVSINPRAGDVPGRKLLAFEKGSNSVSQLYVCIRSPEWYLAKVIVLSTINMLVMAFQV